MCHKKSHKLFHFVDTIKDAVEKCLKEETFRFKMRKDLFHYQPQKNIDFAPMIQY